MLDKNTIQLYKRLLSYIRPYWKMVALTLVTLLLAASMEPLMPALLKPLIDKGLIAKETSTITQIPFFILAIFFVKGVAEYVSKVASEWVAHKAILDIRAEMFAKFNTLPLSKHDEFTTGKLLSKITYDVPQVGNSLSEAWIIIIRDTLIIVFLLGYLLYTSWQLSLLLLIVGPIMAFIIDRASKMMRASSKGMQDSMGELTHRLEEGINGYKDIKIFGAETYEQSRFHASAESLRKHTMDVMKVSALNVPLVQFLAAAALAAVIYAASLMSAQNLFTTGGFISYITAMAMVFEPVRRLTNINETIQRGMAAATSIFELLDQPNEINTGTKTLQNCQHVITLQNLNFGYPNSQKRALNNLNLSIPANQTTAFVGQSGSGKTTLANLIARFYRVNPQSLFIDNIDINDLELNNLRQNIAFVSQNVILFNDTIAANIAYGHSEFNLEQIKQAAIDAHAWEFIEKLPNGLDTQIGENGSTLSGGQRQRIAIARAFLKNAPILIMDEATSALDNQSETMIQQAIEKLRQNRTVIIIAHRLSTVESADQIIVLEEGKLKEKGAHKELITLGGVYANLYQRGSLDELTK